MSINDKILILKNFLADPRSWCKHHWSLDSRGFSTLAYDGVRFCLIGAISHLFPGREGREVKEYLQNYLYVHAGLYIREDVLNPPKDVTPRVDWGNLAKFNDESDHDLVMQFLNEAGNSNLSTKTMQLLAR